MFVTLCLLSLIIADNTAIAHLKVGRCCSIFGCLYRDKWNSWGSLCLPERHMAWVASVQLSSFPWENQGVRYTSSSPSHTGVVSDSAVWPGLNPGVTNHRHCGLPYASTLLVLWTHSDWAVAVWFTKMHMLDDECFIYEKCKDKNWLENHELKDERGL